MIEQLERLMAIGSYVQVRQEAERITQDDTLPAGEQVAVLVLACQAERQLGEFHRAALFAEKAVELARMVGDLTALGRASFELGTIYVQIGETYSAEDHLRDFLALLPVVPVLAVHEGAAHAGLAEVYRQRRQWTVAIASLERALAAFTAHGQVAGLIRAHLDLARCYLTIGATVLASPHLDRVEAHLIAAPEARISAEFICLQALCRRLEGDIAASCRLCREIFAPGRQDVPVAQLGEAAWILGENALAVGHRREAEELGRLALDHAATASWPALMNRAIDLLRRIATPSQIGA